MTEATERTTKLEFTLALLMALAAVGTAWTGFQSTEWSGVQANAYAKAAATRTESVRISTEGEQDRVVDVVTFGSWLGALDDDVLADPSIDPAEFYRPGNEGGDTVGGFMFVRFRDEFQPAMEAWLATDPFDSPDAPGTPFEMPEYRLAADAQAHAMRRQADQLSAKARDANNHATNYILNAVLFALVLFFAGIASRAHGTRAQKLLFGFGVAALVIALAVLVAMPVTF